MSRRQPDRSGKIPSKKRGKCVCGALKEPDESEEVQQLEVAEGQPGAVVGGAGDGARVWG